ncbi:MAG TPA: hypothetical protein PKZ84_06655 [Anaerolineae bacterium]|nr:hypothetical protein [Anaerolineae bacterium]HQI83367.1 hypothetical protein [Anaerolineae bacterium]
MKVFDLFSKRQKHLEKGPDVYKYDEIPDPLRVQIVHILRDAIGTDTNPYAPCGKSYKFIYDILCREYGFFRLTNGHEPDAATGLFSFFLSCDELEKVLDVIEISFRYVDTVIRQDRRHQNTYISISPDAAIEELNFRFREHGIGYQFESGRLIRVDSQLLHSEVIKPALQFLAPKTYQGANEEFLKAHEHYRHRRYPECLNECLKSFESTMKVVCDQRKWPYSQEDTAKKLLGICFDNGLIPSFLQAEFTAMRSILESGVPTVRNKLSGHGQGPVLANIPEYFAQYALNMTAANILFLIKAERELP